MRIAPGWGFFVVGTTYEKKNCIFFIPIARDPDSAEIFHSWIVFCPSPRHLRQVQ